MREIFRKVDLSAICSFAGGYPAADTFPVAEIPSLAASVLSKYGTRALQYGATQGVPELREAIASRYGVPVSQVQITTSSQQGIDVCTRVFVNPGDVILADEPVYLGALQSFRAYRAKVMGIHAWLDQVQGMFGPGPISSAGPGPDSMAPRPLQGTSGGPGPGDKSGLSPKTDWTKSKTDNIITPQDIRDTIIDIRRQKLPDPEEVGSAGSFFCNPVISREHFERIVALAREDNGPDYQVPHYEVGDQIKVPAAWLIDQCGFKGAVNGGAQVYPKQPLVIVNASGNAAPEEIIGLEKQVIDTIAAKYGITLHPEVEHI